MLANHKGEIPVFLLLIPYVTGVLPGISRAVIVPLPLLYLLLAIAATAFIVLNLTYKKFEIFKLRWLGGALITVIIFLFGWIITFKNNELTAANHFSKVTGRLLVVQVSNEPVTRNGLVRFTADVKESVTGHTQKPTSGTLLIAVKDIVAHLNYGDQLLIPAKYNAIDPPFVPAGFNYKQYLQYQNVFYQAYLYRGNLSWFQAAMATPLSAIRSV